MNGVRVARLGDSDMLQPGAHLTDDELDDLVRKTLPETALARVEEHMLVCEFCRQRIEELDRFVASLRDAARALEPCDAVHATADGPIRLRVRQQDDGTWCAELLGAEIESVGTFSTQEEASEGVQGVFYEMFPEHVCNPCCILGTFKIA
jgi:hypothetical protein